MKDIEVKIDNKKVGQLFLKRIKISMDLIIL